MSTLALALLIVSLVLFILAAVGVPTGRVALGWAGLAFLAGSMLAGRI